MGAVMSRPSILVGWYSDGGTRRRVEIEPELRETDKGLELAVTFTAGRARKSDGAFILDRFDEPRDYSGGTGMDEVRAVSTFAAGWNGARRDLLADIAERWHLNGMYAYCPHQRDIAAQDGRRPHEVFTTPFSAEQGDTRPVACPVCGYNYGTAWLYEELPADVVEFVREILS